jgi:hypothetical protein
MPKRTHEEWHYGIPRFHGGKLKMSSKKEETKKLPILTTIAAGRNSKLVIDKGAAMYSFANNGIPTACLHIKLTHLKMGADGKPYLDHSTHEPAKETISEYITELIVTYTPETSGQDAEVT